MSDRERIVAALVPSGHRAGAGARCLCPQAAAGPARERKKERSRAADDVTHYCLEKQREQPPELLMRLVARDEDAEEKIRFFVALRIIVVTLSRVVALELVGLALGIVDILIKLHELHEL